MAIEDVSAKGLENSIVVVKNILKFGDITNEERLALQILILAATK